MGGDITSATVTAVGWGIYNDAGKYWPAQVSIEGKCASVIPNCGEDHNSPCPAVPQDFKLNGAAFRFSQDDFGRWIVQALRP